MTDSAGEIEADSSGMEEGVGVGDSCAAATDAQMTIRNAKPTFVIMSSEVETSFTFLKNVERFLRTFA
jgi:hypothetical protein